MFHQGFRPNICTGAGRPAHNLSKPDISPFLPPQIRSCPRFRKRRTSSRTAATSPCLGILRPAAGRVGAGCIKPERAAKAWMRAERDHPRSDGPGSTFISDPLMLALAILQCGKGAPFVAPIPKIIPSQVALEDALNLAVRRPTRLGRRSSADRRRSEKCFGSLQLSVAMGNAQRWMMPSNPPVATVRPSGANASE
jgi:hypothetical protein